MVLVTMVTKVTTWLPWWPHGNHMATMVILIISANVTLTDSSAGQVLVLRSCLRKESVWITKVTLYSVYHIINHFTIIKKQKKSVLFI